MVLYNSLRLLTYKINFFYSAYSSTHTHITKRTHCSSLSDMSQTGKSREKNNMERIVH